MANESRFTQDWTVPVAMMMGAVDGSMQSMAAPKSGSDSLVGEYRIPVVSYALLADSQDDSHLEDMTEKVGCLHGHSACEMQN
jgi:hypothetical protein